MNRTSPLSLGTHRRGYGALVLAMAVLTASLSPNRMQAAAPAASAGAKPNILFILADDLGWGDLSCYGHDRLKTPHLDKLARQGTQFTHFYVNASVCSPSRCAFLTGQYPARHKIFGHYATRESNAARGMSQFLDPQVANVPRLLKTAGYATAHVGKWHLGSNSGGPEPDAYGFDYVGSGEAGGADGPATDPYYRAKSTARFVDESIAFIKERKGAPFYLQLWTLVPHATLNPTPEQLKPFARLRAGGGKFPHASAAEIYYASVSDLDTQVGRLMAFLDEAGLSDNTLVLFSSDNGPEDIHIGNAGHSGIGSAGPFRGRKRSLYEGGIRVPGIVRWPGRVPSARIENTAVVSGVDLLPTLCRLAGAQVPASHALDGEDCSDVLLGASRERTRPLFWEWRFRIFGEPFHHSPQLAVRDGPWKFLMNPDGSRKELYDMRADHTQLDNVAEHHPDIVARLSRAALDWKRTIPDGPLDPGAGRMNYRMPGQAPLAAPQRGKK